MKFSAVWALAGAVVAGIGASSAQAACQATPIDASWTVKVEHISTYPAGPEWNTKLTVHEDGCLVVEAPVALRVGGGRTEWQIPAAHLKGINRVMADQNLPSMRVDGLVAEMKRSGHTDLRRLGAESVEDAPYTVVQFRDPTTGVTSEAVELYALNALQLPKALSQMTAVQDMVLALDRLGKVAIAANAPTRAIPESRSLGQEK